MAASNLDLLSRRQLMCNAARTFLGVGIAPVAAMLPGGSALAAPAKTTGKAKHVIYLFMSGAMSQLDTFDPKPDSQVQGDTGVIKTKVAGVQLSEHLAKTARNINDVAIIRSMSTPTGAHQQGRYLMRTGYKEIASTRHPSLSAWMHKLKGRIHADLPPSVVVGNASGHPGSGYLGAAYMPVPIGDPQAGLEDTKLPAYLKANQLEHRIGLANKFDSMFQKKATAASVKSYNKLYQDAIRLLNSKDLAAFDIAAEPAKTQALYGDDKFGQGCLLARRLIDHGVQFVDVTLGPWDMHNNIFEDVPERAGTLDNALNALITDLKSSGKLDETLIVVATEFGRKPQMNANAGRDHHPSAFSCLLAGGGIQGGQVYGVTDEDAYNVEEDGVSVQDFNATIAHAAGMASDTEIHSPNGRPFTIGNGGRVIRSLF